MVGKPVLKGEIACAWMDIQCNSIRSLYFQAGVLRILVKQKISSKRVLGDLTILQENQVDLSTYGVASHARGGGWA